MNGSVECGKLADLVVLARDAWKRYPWKENPARIVDIPIERTMCGARWTYES